MTVHQLACKAQTAFGSAGCYKGRWGPEMAPDSCPPVSLPPKAGVWHGPWRGERFRESQRAKGQL